jgi:hypothetical protein
MEGKSSERSNRSTEGRGLGVRLVVIALVGILLVGTVLFFVESNASGSSGPPGQITTVSTTGVSCNDPSMPEAAQQLEQEAAFESLSDGLCFNYLGQNFTAAPGATVLTFARYNDTLVYPCGVSPVDVPQSVIQYFVSGPQKTGALRALNSSAISEEFGLRGPCAAGAPVRVVSITDVGSLVPAVPELNLTVSSFSGPARVTALAALLKLNGGTQRFGFGVAPSKPLAQGAEASEAVIVTGLNFTAHQVYPMTLEGMLSDGQAFDYVVTVQIADIPGL